MDLISYHQACKTGKTAKVYKTDYSQDDYLCCAMFTQILYMNITPWVTKQFNRLPLKQQRAPLNCHEETKGRRLPWNQGDWLRMRSRELIKLLHCRPVSSALCITSSHSLQAWILFQIPKCLNFQTNTHTKKKCWSGGVQARSHLSYSGAKNMPAPGCQVFLSQFVGEGFDREMRTRSGCLNLQLQQLGG